jgi:xanthine dehydrogenase accessory factor
MTDDTPDRDEGGTASRADAAAPEQVERLAAEYLRTGRPFARVTVVRREPPVSAVVGDRAIVTDDGDLVGWIGGAACAQSVAVKEATAALERGEPAFVGLAPDPDDVARPGLSAYPMTCHSGGTLELFIEPVVPGPRLVVVGESPIARALSRLAGETGYDVTVATGPDGDGVAVSDTDALAAPLDEAAAVVVASMGAYDEAGLEAALRAGVAHVGLVASARRRDEVAEEVAETLGVEIEAVAERVSSPVGLDIGAKTPEEIAVSILAELVAVRRGAVSVESAAPLDLGDDEPTATHDHGHDDTADVETAIDPVCGMDVVVGEALTVTYGGERYHFCGEGCAAAFERDPERYLDEVAAGD